MSSLKLSLSLSRAWSGNILNSLSFLVIRFIVICDLLEYDRLNRAVYWLVDYLIGFWQDWERRIELGCWNYKLKSLLRRAVAVIRLVEPFGKSLLRQDDLFSDGCRLGSAFLSWLWVKCFGRGLWPFSAVFVWRLIAKRKDFRLWVLADHHMVLTRLLCEVSHSSGLYWFAFFF